MVLRKLENHLLNNETKPATQKINLEELASYKKKKKIWDFVYVCMCVCVPVQF